MLLDFHMHTNCSDGTLSPEALIDLALQCGLAKISITDHDTLSGLVRAQSYCAGKIGFVPGVEITGRETFFPTTETPLSLHLLGYGFDPQNAPLRARLAERERAEYACFERCVASLGAFGMNFSLSEVPRSCGGQMQLCDIESYIVKQFKASPRLPEAVASLLSFHKPLDALNTPPETAISLIHGAGGKVVWAHPLDGYGDLKKRRLPESDIPPILDMLCKWGLDGIEANYRDFTPKQRAFLVQTAAHYKLFTTAGSDFHGLALRRTLVDYPTSEPPI